MTNGVHHPDSSPGETGDGAVLLLAQQGDPPIQKKLRKNASVAKGEDQIEVLRSEVSNLRREVHGLRSKLHGELAVLALRIEDNDQRSMRRRAVMRRWAIAAIVAAWLWHLPGLLLGVLGGAFLLPGLLLVSITTIGGIATVLLLLNNGADEQDHKDRYSNWFRLTNR